MNKTKHYFRFRKDWNLPRSHLSFIIFILEKPYIAIIPSETRNKKYFLQFYFHAFLQNARSGLLGNIGHLFMSEFWNFYWQFRTENRTFLRFTFQIYSSAKNFSGIFN